MKKVFIFLLLLSSVLSNTITVSAVDTFDLKMRTGEWVEFANLPLPDEGVFLLEEGHIEKFEQLSIHGKLAEIYGFPANFFGDPNILVENGLELEVTSDVKLLLTSGDEVVQLNPVESLEKVFQLEAVESQTEDRKELIYLTASDSFMHLIKYIKEGDKEFVTLNSFTQNMNAADSLSSEKIQDEILVMQELTDGELWHLYGSVTLSVDPTDKLVEGDISYEAVVNFTNTEINDDLLNFYEKKILNEQVQEKFIESYIQGYQHEPQVYLGTIDENGFYFEQETDEIDEKVAPSRTNLENVFVHNLLENNDRILYFRVGKELYMLSNSGEYKVTVMQLLLEDDERLDEAFIAEKAKVYEEVESSQATALEELKKEEKTYSPPESTQKTKPANDAPSEFYNNDSIAEDIYPAIVTVVQQAVAQNEGISGAKFPWGYEDYNINSLGGDMYNTRGQFSHNGYVYNFELIIFMRPDTSGRVEFYNVY